MTLEQLKRETEQQVAATLMAAKQAGLPINGISLTESAGGDINVSLHVQFTPHAA